MEYNNEKYKISLIKELNYFRSVLTFLFFTFLLNSYLPAQMQKIIPDTSIFKNSWIGGVAIYNNNAIVNYKEYLNPIKNYDNYIVFEKKSNKKFTYLQEEKFYNGEDFNYSFSPTLFGNRIVMCKKEPMQSIFKTLTFENGKFKKEDTIFFDSIYSIRNHVINKDWLVCRTEYIKLESIIISVDKFFKRLDNEWFLKDSFKYSRPIAQSISIPSLKYKINDKFAIIGDPYDENDGKDKGVVNIYELKNGNWKLFKSIKQPDPNQLFNNFGMNVSISPDNHFLAISSRNVDQGNEFYSIYIFEFLNDDIILNKKIVEPAKIKNWGFNLFFEITDDELLVGLPYGDNERGIIRYYKYSNGDWIRGRDIQPPIWDTHYGNFGHGLDRYKETIITGAPNDTEQSGAAYIFQIPARDTVTTSVCKNEGFAFGDTTYYESGTYRDTLIASYGVDSVVMLNLTVLPVSKSKIDTLLCEGDSLKVGDKALNKTGNFEIKLKNTFGCDSTVSVKLRMIDRDYHLPDTTLCYGKTLTIGNQNITESGIYSIALKNKNACDSIIHIKVDFIPPDIVVKDTSVCSGETLIINGEEIKEPGSYDFPLINKYGCDSTVTYNVKFNSSDEIKIDTAICEGSTVKVGDQSFTHTGKYLISLQNRFGCDSTITLNLKMLKVNRKEIDTILCPDQSIKIGDNEISGSGNYQIALQNQAGCDSIIDLTVRKTEIDTTSRIISDIGCASGAIMLTAESNSPPLHYLWSNGSTELSITGLLKGQYELRITDNAGCKFVLQFDIPERKAYYIPEVFTPDDQNNEINRTFRIFTTDPEDIEPRVKVQSIKIFNRWGETVYSSESNSFWDGTFRKSPASAGIYLYSIAIESPCGIENVKGQVLLLR